MHWIASNITLSRHTCIELTGDNNNSAEIASLSTMSVMLRGPQHEKVYVQWAAGVAPCSMHMLHPLYDLCNSLYYSRMALKAGGDSMRKKLA